MDVNKILASFIEDLDAGRIDLYKSEIRSILPRRLYKYIALGKSKENDEIKLKSLSENTTWLGLPSSMNDPYEFLAFKYLKFSLDSKDKMFKVTFKGILDMFNSFKISSFTDDYRSLPMWAYYANDYKGICIEYEFNNEVNNLEIFRPVKYTNNIEKCSQELLQKYKDYIETLTPEELEQTIDYKITIEHLKLLMCQKHYSWKHENEIRLVFWDSFPEGRSVDNRDLGLKIKRIYIGTKCDNKTKNKIIEIATNDLKVEARTILINDIKTELK